VESARARIETLTSLRDLLGLAPEYDLTERQWRQIETRFAGQRERLMGVLGEGAARLLPRAHEAGAQRELNALLGRIELELARALTMFDTYMDVLSQRHLRPLGEMLAGCDELARDALARPHPALATIEAPLVYCDRGFGASTLRSEIRFPGRGRNPMPLIQIPYTRLREKYNLTSILHEAGHEGMVRLGLRGELPEVLRRAARGAGAGEAVGELFAQWSTEIGPDAWSFCGSGLAAVGTMQEILALPPEQVYRIHWRGPHPPPWLRVRLGCRWCRDMWGRGVWDEWERVWVRLYPLAGAPEEYRGYLEEGARVLGAISEAVLRTRFRTLGGRELPSLFSLEELAPARLEGRIERGRVRLGGLGPCGQLAVFRLLRERGETGEEALDKLMTRWLGNLAEGSRRRAGERKSRGDKEYV
jgi:hypothetical protein